MTTQLFCLGSCKKINRKFIHLCVQLLLPITWKYHFETPYLQNRIFHSCLVSMDICTTPSAAWNRSNEKFFWRPHTWKGLCWLSAPVLLFEGTEPPLGCISSSNCMDYLTRQADCSSPHSLSLEERFVPSKSIRYSELLSASALPEGKYWLGGNNN